MFGVRFQYDFTGVDLRNWEDSLMRARVFNRASADARAEWAVAVNSFCERWSG